MSALGNGVLGSLVSSSGSLPSEELDHHSGPVELERQISELTNQNLKLLEQKQTLERRLATVQEPSCLLTEDQAELRIDQQVEQKLNEFAELEQTNEKLTEEIIKVQSKLAQVEDEASSFKEKARHMLVEKDIELDRIR